MNNLKLLPFLFLYLIVSCSKPDKAADLNGCCLNPAVDVSVGNGHIYIPNIFTPDDDGTNDRFFVVGDSIQQIDSFIISDQDQNTVFESFTALPNNSDFGWDGSVNGVIEKGVYIYRLTVTAENGVSRLIQGKVCNHPCDEDGTGPEITSVDDCQFPVQVSDGRFNPNIPSFEENECFE